LIRNVHERRLPLTRDEAGALLDSLASDGDRLWPADRWPAMRFPRPLDAGAPPFSLRVGALGGHGPITYEVTEYVPGRRVSFAFHPPRWIDGTHTFEVLDGDRDGEVVLRHTLTGRLRGAGRVVWPVAVRWLHDALLEDLLDNAARAAGQAATSTWSPWVRLLRGRRRARPARTGAGAAVPRRRAA
jgi:hypothetical protein